MRRTLAAPGLAAVLGMALLLTACGKTNAHNNTAGETVSTALFDFSITDVSLVHWKRNPTTCRLCLGGTFLSVKRLDYRQR